MPYSLNPTGSIGARGVRRLRKESGVTLLMVAVGMFALLSMAIISLDVVNVYMASNQAQKTADAAALAGAEALVSSSTASNSVPLNSVCNGSNGDADLRAQAVAAQNTIAGVPPTTVTTSCPSTAPPHNPQIQVVVTRTGIPTFFARMWGSAASAVSATAIAEAYNPSFDPANALPDRPPIAIHGIKPWLVNNCSTNACTQFLFFMPNHAIANGGCFIGHTLRLTTAAPSTICGPGGTSAQFIGLDGPTPLACPSTSAVSCSQIGSGSYHDNIACENGYNFSNGQLVGPGQVFQVAQPQPNLQSLTTGTECLIHASGTGLLQGQDSFTFTGAPVTITGGSNNPNASLRLVNSIHRSDSVVTVPVSNCPGPCDPTAQLQIVGFLQLGIRDVTPSTTDSTPGDIEAVILNAAGLDPASTGTPITGAGTSPVVMRLNYQ